jgi:hypothetical protein
MTDENLIPGTYWVLKKNQNGNSYAVKVQWKNDEAKIREVFLASGEWHHPNEQDFVLPKSYRMYMGDQNFIVMPANTRWIAFPDGTFIDFFGTYGVESISNREFVSRKVKDFEMIAISADEVRWSKPKLGDWSKMRFPIRSNKDKSTRLTVEEVVRLFQSQPTGPIVLKDEQDAANVSYRTVFIDRGYVVILKLFPKAQIEDRISVKFYHEPAHVHKIVTYWNTITPVLKGSNEYEEVKKTVMPYYYTLISRFRKGNIRGPKPN